MIPSVLNESSRHPLGHQEPIDSIPCQPVTTPAADCQTHLQLLAAASRALVIDELDAQAFGGSSKWNQAIRPGRQSARIKSLRFIVAAAELARTKYPQLTEAELVAAVESFRLSPQYCLVSALTGEWITPNKPAIRKRGEELAQAIADAAFCIRYAIDQHNESKGGRQP